MSTTSMKKLSAAACAVFLGLSAVARAGTVPYTTSFETTPDAEGQTYSAGALVNQSGWTYEDGEAGAGTATVVSGTPSLGSGSIATGTQSVELQTPGTAAGYYDVYNSTLADHVGSTAAVPGTPLDPTLSGGVVNVSFAMSHSTGTTGDGAGMDIFDSADNLVAALFAVTNPATGSNDLEVYDASTGGFDVVSGLAGSGVADGNYGTYSISLDFTSGYYTVALGSTGAVSQEYAMGTNDGLIGGIAFATDDVSGTAASAYFDDLDVVPEPASIGMVGLGGLLLLAKRPKRQLA